jgi:ketosteroid isomerase-like protein
MRVLHAADAKYRTCLIPRAVSCLHPLRNDQPGDETMTIERTARAFFEACETGGGWAACEPYCHQDARFDCQADALADVTTLAGYADWMKGLLTPIPDGRYALTGFAVDADRATVVASAVFHGTQTGPGGPAEPTGEAVVSDYAYVMRFDGDRIAHMTKIWNDGHALRQLRWA